MGDLGFQVVVPRATRAVLVLAVLGTAAGCKAPPPRPPLIDAGVASDTGSPVDAPIEAVDAEPLDAAPIDASVDAGAPSTDAGPTDAGPEPIHPGTGTWSACVPEAANRICYFVPAAIATSGMDTIVRQRVAIDVDGLIHESGSVPPFGLRVAPTNSVGEFPLAGSSSSGGGAYFELLFELGMPIDGWAACNAGARRFRVLRSGVANVALEFELDCTAMPGVQIRGALVGGAAFSGWRTDPIDGE